MCRSRSLKPPEDSSVALPSLGALVTFFTILPGTSAHIGSNRRRHNQDRPIGKGRGARRLRFARTVRGSSGGSGAPGEMVFLLSYQPWTRPLYGCIGLRRRRRRKKPLHPRDARLREATSRRRRGRFGVRAAASRVSIEQPVLGLEKGDRNVVFRLRELRFTLLPFSDGTRRGALTFLERFLFGAGTAVPEIGAIIAIFYETRTESDQESLQ